MAELVPQIPTAVAPRRIFLVAAEESGDRLGAALMRALRQNAGSIASGAGVELAGVGGREMASAGLAQHYQVEGLGFVGFTAIPQRAVAIWRHIRQTADAVIAARPDVLVIIDSPDFTHRVARRVRAQQPAIPIVDYVSPSVWAWRPGRARAMRAYVDHVLALLPFEPEVLARLGGPTCNYVGHPIIEHAAELRPNAEEALRRQSSPPLLLVLPGSRAAEIGHLIGPFEAAIKLAAARCGALDVVIPAVPELLDRITTATAGWVPRPRILVEVAEHRAAFRSARAALAASGTVTLELAVAGVPTVVAYKASPVEYLTFKTMVRVPSVVLANLVLGENAMPEFLQNAATPERLAAALVPLLSDTPERRAQTAAFARIDAVLEIGGPDPSAKAADIVLDAAARGDHLRRDIG
jgi:lipid-A-disaccharide synthase